MSRHITDNNYISNRIPNKLSIIQIHQILIFNHIRKHVCQMSKKWRKDVDTSCTNFLITFTLINNLCRKVFIFLQVHTIWLQENRASENTAQTSQKLTPELSLCRLNAERSDAPAIFLFWTSVHCPDFYNILQTL